MDTFGFGEERRITSVMQTNIKPWIYRITTCPLVMTQEPLGYGT